jgi:arylsulfatase A-like enzyme
MSTTTTSPEVRETTDAASSEPHANGARRGVVDLLRRSATAGLFGGALVFLFEASDRVATLWPSFNSPGEPFLFTLYLAPVVFLGLFAGLVAGPVLAALGAIANVVEQFLERRFGARAAVAAPVALASVLTVAGAIALAVAINALHVRSLRRFALTLSLYFMDANAMLLARIAHAAANWVFPLLVAGVFAVALVVVLAPRMLSSERTAFRAALVRSAIAALFVALLYAFDSRFEFARYDTLVHVPAAALQALVAFFAAGVVLGAPRRAARRWVDGAAVAILLFAIAGAAFAVYHVGRNENLKALLWRRSVVARRFYEAAVALSDRDRDGFSTVFAGGDGNDRDPNVNPLATEIPANGVDDNCIGGDLAVAPAAPRALAGPDVANGRRVVLIAIDTLRADRMSLYGYARPTTPRIAEHARSGLVFDACQSAGTNTAVAFSAMQTSASRGGVFEPDRTRLFPRLRAAGYETGQVNAVLEDIWLRAKSSSQPYRRVILDGIHNFPHELGEDFWDADRVTDTAIAYLSSLPADRPSATWVHYFDPHTPRRKMAPYDYGDSASDMYDTEVAFADREVGRLLDWMRDSGFAKDALVILVSDHGEAFLEHGMDFHGNRPYAEQLDVPLVVWAPELAPGRTAAPASIRDIAPTIYEFLGLAPAPDAEGLSLLPPAALDRPLFAETPLNIVDGPFHAFSATRNDWKLIYDVVGNTTELYDLTNDPRELHNLADREPERVAELRALLAGWLDTTRSVETSADARALESGD